MTIQEFLTRIYKIAKRKDDLWIGIGITDIEYKDRKQSLRVVFGYYEQQDVWYELLIDDVFFFLKMEGLTIEDSIIETKLPENPFINIYSQSKVLAFVKHEFMVDMVYGEDSGFKHIQLTAQNMILNIVSRSEPVINSCTR